MSARILIIEDDEAILKFLRRGLAYEGYQVDTATDGQSGLGLARDNPPDLVVLDLMLPGIDGMEVCRRLRAGGSVPILILTAKDTVNDRIQGLDMGADDFMVKPFNLDELLARIRALLRRAQPSPRPQVLRFADLSLDTGTRQAARGDRIKKILQSDVELLAEVDSVRRWDIMRNHSVTHFLHAALRKVLGTHVQQAGSYVGPDHLRFDFTHFTKPSPEELHDIEILVNEQVRRNLPMYHHRNIPFEEAKKMGALMFFGDKYGDRVNVVQFGDFTKEFCGGTHVKNSSEIGLFKIISEASIASGVRRIEAVTGAGVEKYIQSQLEHMKQFSLRIDELLDTKKKLEKEISDLKLKEKLGQLDHILSLRF